MGLLRGIATGRWFEELLPSERLYVEKLGKEANLCLSYPKTIDKAHSEALNKPDLVQFFERVAQDSAISTIPAALKFACDESWIDNKGKKIKVWHDFGKKPISKLPKLSDGHITLLQGVAADGSKMKPHLILDLVSFPMELDELKEHFTFSGSTIGWQTRQLFLEWVKVSFIPHLKKVTSIFPVALLLSHS